MRIISGKNKGRKIIAPNNLPVRPTTDFAKEALFNILTNQVDFSEIDVLDLFSGTGNISYEFVSRSAKTVIAVDADLACTNFIRQTALKLNYNNLVVIRSDYSRFISQTNQNWDVIFADPPYDMSEVNSLPLLIQEYGLLKPGGLFILEHKKTLDFSNFKGFQEQRVYGNVKFSLFGEK